MNIILYGIPDDTAELIAGRYDLELIHSIEEIGACGTLLPVHPGSCWLFTTP